MSTVVYGNDISTKETQLISNKRASKTPNLKRAKNATNFLDYLVVHSTNQCYKGYEDKNDLNQVVWALGVSIENLKQNDKTQLKKQRI